MLLISARIARRLSVPRPSGQSMFSWGIFTSVRASSQIGVVLVPRRSKGLLTETPGVSLGTKKKLRPLSFLAGSVWQRTVKNEATGPLVTQVLSPLRTYPSAGLCCQSAHIPEISPCLRLGETEAGDFLSPHGREKVLLVHFRSPNGKESSFPSGTAWPWLQQHSSSLWRVLHR